MMETFVWRVLCFVFLRYDSCKEKTVREGGGFFGLFKALDTRHRARVLNMSKVSIEVKIESGGGKAFGFLLSFCFFCTPRGKWLRALHEFTAARPRL